MFDIGGGELLLILIAVVVLFGPKKLPEIAQMIGKGVQQVRKAQSQFTSQLTEIKDEVNNSIQDSHNNNYKPPVRNSENSDPITKNND